MDIIADILPLIGMLICLGAVAGFMAGLLGIGGGIILVPGLYFAFSYLQPNMGFDAAHLMHISVGTSLAIIVPTGLSSALAHHRRGSVDFGLVLNIGIGIIGGVAVATWVVTGLNANAMKIIFASVILILSMVMIFNPVRFKISDEKLAQPFIGFAGFFIGLISALAGIGGATLSVPYMSLHGVSMRKSVGSASAIGVVIAVPAAIGFMFIGAQVDNLPPYSIGYINVMAWAFIVITSVIFAPLGARVAHKISVRKLKIVFAVFMMIVAFNIWHEIWWANKFW